MVPGTQWWSQESDIPCGEIRRFWFLTVTDVPVRNPDADVIRLAPHADLALPAHAHPGALVRPTDAGAAVEAVHAAVADLGMKKNLISENEIICVPR